MREFAEFFRESARGLDDVCETIAWLGIPWRWAFRYDISDDSSPILAILAPLPERPVVCIPLSHALIEAIPTRRLTRFIRDSIQRGPRVGGVLWCEWELTAKSQAEELVGIVRRKRQFIAERNA